MRPRTPMDLGPTPQAVCALGSPATALHTAPSKIGSLHLPSLILRRAATGMLLLATLAGCASLPAPPSRLQSHAFTDTAGTRIGRSAQHLAAPHPGLTGARALLDAREAFVARYAMALGAERSIDVQTYIWP